MKTFDPVEYINQLQTLLINDKKKIGFLFGAGINLAKKNEDTITIPAINELTKKVIDEINEKNYKKALKEIKNEIGEDRFNIETLLSCLHSKFEAIGNGKLNGLCKSDFENLINKIKSNIKNLVSIHKNINIQNHPHDDFAKWIKNANRNIPIEIFTTNYDFLLEIAFEENNIHYYDGFVGSYEPFFSAELVEDLKILPDFVKLWKIHGSLGWYYEKNKNKIIKKYNSNNNEDLFIYPSHLKYSESKKMPYEALMDRLNNFLKQDDALLIIIGYSFNDHHINERIISGVNKSNNSSIIAFLHEDNFKENNKVAFLAKNNKRLSVYSKRNTVIGGIYGEWKLKKEPSKDDTININLFFDEDAPQMNEEINKEIKGDEKWTGSGVLILTDFNSFVKFITEMII